MLLKFGGKNGKSAGDEGSGHSPLISRAGNTVVESVASRSFFSLPNVTESFVSDHFIGDTSQQPCFSRQVDAALGFS